jgi:hypothetical protein
MAYEPKWGVTVEQVSALAPHVTLATGDAPAPPADPLYSNKGIRPITRAQVEGWITAVSARVEGRLWRLAELSDGHPARAALDLEAADVIANGAASYLVDAAFPGKAAPNENTSYGQVLRSRYEEGLAELETRLVAVIEGTLSGGAVRGPEAVSSEFPAPMFPDGIRF